MLGTSCMVPTKERNVSGIYIEVNGKGILFDCGEGSQRQMNIAGINRNKVRYIFISHWHADHVSGILGLLQTIQNSGAEEIKIFGPLGTKEHFNHLLQCSIWESKLNITVDEFDCESICELFSNDDFSVSAVNLSHGIPTLGFSIKEKDKRRVLIEDLKKEGVPEGPHLADLQEGKDIEYEGKNISFEKYTAMKTGKKFTYIADTVFSENLIALATDSDVLVSEATYSKEHEEKAEKYNHLTSEQAGQIASMSNSKKLLLTHFSQRYKTADEVVEDAKTVFPNTEAAYDLMKIKL